MSWPAIKQGFNQEPFRRYVIAQSWNRWRPSKIIWHNTAAPSLAQWIKSADADKAAGLVPGITRIRSLESYFQNDRGWSGCPHLFVANDLIWVMNSLTAPGVHSPSFNSTSIGIEMIGDFDTEDDDTGEGLKVKNNSIFATAIICETLGINPRGSILLHKEDPKTTHDCPGRNIAADKFEMIESVISLLGAGEHDPEATSTVISGAAPSEPQRDRQGRTTIKNLQFRKGPGAINESTGSLPNDTPLVILVEAKNETTTWLKVRTPAGYVGWVSGQFVKEST